MRKRLENIKPLYDANVLIGSRLLFGECPTVLQSSHAHRYSPNRLPKTTANLRSRVPNRLCKSKVTSIHTLEHSGLPFRDSPRAGGFTGVTFNSLYRDLADTFVCMRDV